MTTNKIIINFLFLLHSKCINDCNLRFNVVCIINIGLGSKFLGQN